MLRLLNAAAVAPTIATAALLLEASEPSQKPMLWETTTRVIFVKALDEKYQKQKERVVRPEKTKLCLRPYTPKVGKVRSTVVDCKYIKVADRKKRISRTRICTNEFGAEWKTKISGIETENYYDLSLVTKLRDRTGKQLEESVVLESGRLLGECPPGMPVIKPLED